MKRSVQYMTYLLLVVYMTLFTACLVDLRPSLVKDAPSTTEANVAKGRAILSQSAKAHGIEAYQEKENIEIILRDEWAKGIKSAAMPWYKNKEQVILQYLIGTNDSRLLFQEGKAKGNTWGIQNWATYTQEANETPIFKQKNKLKFWLPTIQYFMEMPFAIQTAELVTYAGEESLNGQKYDLVFASWGKLEPQRKTDQYLLWINQETHLLDYAQYTIRDMAGFLKGAMKFEDFREIDGVKIAFKQTAGNVPDMKNFLHQYVIEDLKFNVAVEQADFYPDIERVYQK